METETGKFDETLRWRHKRLSADNLEVPPSPGIYLIGHIETHFGLPTTHVYVYAGKSDNLHRRLSQHSLQLEPNPGLSDYLRRPPSEARAWYTTEISNGDIDTFEQEIIRYFSPRFNRMTYKKEQ